MIQLILTITAVVVFLAYNAVAIYEFGVPPSLSDTYYYFEGKKNNLGWVFTGMMWFVAMVLVFPWIEITNAMTGWSHYFTALPFFAVCSICFIGAAPRFKPVRELENKVHMTSAACSAIFSTLWIAIVMYPISWLIPFWLLFIGAIAHTLGLAKKGRDYWLEMAAFGATFSAIITGSIGMIL